MSVIEIEGLRKHYLGFRGGTTALDGLDLVVEEGGVFGFLGPNGAGKTTTIRCLMGLARPTAGSARILGVDPNKELHKVIRRIGSIVETPTFFGRFSGQRNLLLLGRLHGIGKQGVRAAMQRVGLGGREKDLVRDYSLGMKQRLGLAAALLKDPELLILDEPAHGLDPAGITEFRNLLRRLGDEGRTIFLSSHLLSEVQQICDHVAILRQGRDVASGSVSEILGMTKLQRMVVGVDDPNGALAVLREAGMEAELVGGRVEVNISPDRANEITRVLATKGLYLKELRAPERSLEEVYFELTEGESA